MEIFLRETFYPKNETCSENSLYPKTSIDEIAQSFGPLSYTVSFILSLFLTSLVGTVAIQKISSKTANIKNKSKSVVRIPSLFSLPVVGPFYPLLWKDAGSLIFAWVSKLGTTFRFKVVGKEIVILSKPAWVQKLLTSKETGHLLKVSSVYEVIFPGFLKNGLISTSNIPVWKNHRTVLAKAFSFESLKAYLTVLNKHASNFVQELDEVSKQEAKDEQKSLHAMLHEYHFRSTTEILVGVNSLSKDESMQLHQEFFSIQDIISYRFYNPWLLNENLWSWHPKKKEFENTFSHLTSIFQKIIDASEEPLPDEKHVKSFVDYMVAAGLSSEEIHSEIANNFSAGYDTVAITLDYFLFNMACNPEIQDRCREEIDQVISKHAVADGDETLNMDGINDMKYLEMCLKENMRLYPPIPLIVRELGAPLKLEDDLELEEKTLVFLTPRLIQRDPEIYPDPEKFDPDRFLPENVQNRSAYSYLPFSHGARNCIGVKLAMIQMKLLASYILRNYEVYTENTYEKLESKLTDTLWPAKDLGVLWRRRKDKIDKALF